MHAGRLLGALLVGVVAGCQPDRPSAAPTPSLFDPLSYKAPPEERLAFGIQDGNLRNYFHRQGASAAHVLTRSGTNPRVIVAFPANDQGIGIWFLSAAESTRLFIGSSADPDAVAAGGGLQSLLRDGGEHPLHGVRALLESNATRLSTELVLLGSVRTLRDYGHGQCLEDAAKFPPLRNESIRLEGQNALRIRREQIGGEHSMELLLAGLSGTTISLRDRNEAARPECPLGEGPRQPIVDISNDAGIELQLIALSSEEPLTPIEVPDLIAGDSDNDGPELKAFAFLSYEEKLLAGSWRFLTYFGRDTLLTAWLLLPKLEPPVALSAVGSVLERVQLDANVPAPAGGVVPPGDVAHEEEIGDYAAWKNQQLSPPPADLRQPRYDYQMIDDDFLLAPVVAGLARKLEPPPRKGTAAKAKAATSTAKPTEGARAPASPFEVFLLHERRDGRTFEQALLANLELVLSRARPFADDPRPAAEKKQLLVPLHENLSVGQWRDSEMGLAFGRYPFDVNAALVPSALEAAGVLYERLGRSAEAAEARRMGAAWKNVEELFRIELPLEVARTNVASYAAAVGVADTSSTLLDQGNGNDLEYGIALDAALQPLPVQHSDHGFVLAFAQPSEAYLRHVGALLVRPFPAGLLSPVGVMVANPALAEPTLSVVDPKRRDDPNDDVSTPLRDLFTPAHYHGTVVWSWQQALLAAGLRRQLGRKDIGTATRNALRNAECALWRVIDASGAVNTGELWSWAPDEDRHPQRRAFGAGALDADESNAVQLWSTAYLAIQKPTPAQNPRCGATAAGR